MLRSVHLSVITPPRPDMGAECCDERVCVCVSVCLSAIISSKHVRSSLNFLCMLPIAVAQSFSGGVMICYVRPVYG